MADWETRKKEVIELTAPSGATYTAKWRGNPIEITNKVGIHAFPGISGVKTQDLGTDAFIYALTLYFDGVDNDRDASDFMDDFKNQQGNWEIIHPVKGPIFVTKISAKELVDPTDSGNVTVIETNWIEGLPDSSADSAIAIQSNAEFLSGLLDEAASGQFFNNAKIGLPGQVQKIITTTGKVITAINKNLALIENASIIDPKVQAITGAIQNILNGDVLDTASLGSQLLILIDLFVGGQPDARTGISMYETFTDEVLTLRPESPTLENLGQIAVVELAALGGLNGTVKTSLIGGMQSRSEAVTLSQKVVDTFNAVVQSLDETQTLYNENFIDQTYFSQTETFADAMRASSEAIRFMLNSLYALPAERTVILQQDKATIQVAKDEYGNVNTIDQELGNYYKLVESNNFCCDKIWWLPAGTEVLIYQSN